MNLALFWSLGREFGDINLLGQEKDCKNVRNVGPGTQFIADHGSVTLPSDLT